jgi:hypothetical protein
MARGVFCGGSARQCIHCSMWRWVGRMVAAGLSSRPKFGFCLRQIVAWWFRLRTGARVARRLLPGTATECTNCAALLQKRSTPSAVTK